MYTQPEATMQREGRPRLLLYTHSLILLSLSLSLSHLILRRAAEALNKKLEVGNFIFYCMLINVCPLV